MIPNIVKVGGEGVPTTLEFVDPWVAYTFVAVGGGNKAVLCCRRSQ